MVETMLVFLCAMACAVLTAWGVGGGTVLLLVMTLGFGVDQQTAQGINLLFFIPSATGALWYHYKAGFLHTPTLKKAIPWGMACAAIGAFVAVGIGVNLLQKVFGVYLLVAGVRLLWPEKPGD